MDFINNNELYYPVQFLIDRLVSLGDTDANNLANFLFKFEESMK